MVTELQRFVGMTNQLAKFVPSLATMTAPLRSILGKNSSWLWGEPQETAFNQIRQLLTSTEILAHYGPAKDTIIAADASNDSIGAVLLQKQGDGSWCPVCFILRSLSDAEKHYAVIEKEALAVTWASERLEEYILGIHYTIETDHKPLVPLLNTKDIAKMLLHIQRFRLRLMRYNYNVKHVEGKTQTTADALSQAPVSNQIKQLSIFWQTFQYMQRNALKHSRHQAGKFKKLKRSSILIQKQPKSYSTANLDDLVSCLIYHWWSNTGKTAITSQSSMTCYYLMTDSSFPLLYAWTFFDYTRDTKESPKQKHSHWLVFGGHTSPARLRQWWTSVPLVQSTDQSAGSLCFHSVFLTGHGLTLLWISLSWKGKLTWSSLTTFHDGLNCDCWRNWTAKPPSHRSEVYLLLMAFQTWLYQTTAPSLSAGNSKFLLRNMGSLMSLHLQDTLAAMVRQKGQFEQSKTCSKKQLIHMMHFYYTVQHH